MRCKISKRHSKYLLKFSRTFFSRIFCISFICIAFSNMFTKTTFVCFLFHTITPTKYMIVQCPTDIFYWFQLTNHANFSNFQATLSDLKEHICIFEHFRASIDHYSNEALKSSDQPSFIFVIVLTSESRERTTKAL